VISDYQCPDCRILEEKLAPLVGASDISVSAMHFPFCPDCNKHLKANMHPNACWAARAAEAAGLVAGPEGFWRMHRWLFSRSGAFTDADLDAAIREFTIPREAFLEAMRGEGTLGTVRADIDAAIGFGLASTPMLFVNGVEIRGWRSEGAIGSAIDAARRGAGGRAADRPVDARTRAINDWRASPERAIASRPGGIAFGDARAGAEVVVFGDYQEPNTAELDGVLRVLAKDGAVRYVFRHFPADQKCNPRLPRTIHPLACRMARLAEAAASAGDGSQAGAVHAWLFENRQMYSDNAFAKYTSTIGLDGPVLLRAADSAEVGSRVKADIDAGWELGITSLPAVYVRGRLLGRWQDGILQAVLDER